MEKEIHFRQYESGDDENIVDLLSKAFPKWRAREDRFNHWRWKYLESPNGSNIFVASSGGKVVGVIHHLNLRIKIGDSVRLCNYSDDTAVDKEYRNFGVYKQLKELSQQKRKDAGIGFYYYATQSPAIVHVSQKRGDQLFPHSLAHYIKVMDVEAVLKQRNKDTLLNKLILNTLQKTGDLREALTPKTRTSHDYEIREVPSFDDRINQFWNSLQVNYDYIIEKKRDYLNWRHSENKDTSIRLASKDGRVIGYSVLYNHGGDYREGNISDLMTVPDRLDVADALISDALEYFDKAVSVRYTPTKGHPYEKIAAQHGFVDVSRENRSYFYYGLTGDNVKDDFDKMLPPRVILQYY